MAKPVLLISDLHLDRSAPDTIEQFLLFLQQEASAAAALYILGDFFEVWIGDDDPDPDKRRIVAALKHLTDSGVPCFVMHGNRDFLLGKRFCREAGVQLLADHVVVELFGKRVLLMHGDTLCTDDHDYQRLRRIVRNPLVKGTLGSLPLPWRLRLAQRMREGSKAHLAQAERSAPTIMDVNQEAVLVEFARHDVRYIVHGHTHRPAIHRIETSHGLCVRIVLGDWYTQGSALRWEEHGFELLTMQR